MITSLYVDNFKSLVDFRIDFHENNVIVGNNATGKSTILQAINFMCSSIKEDFGIILERRGWKIGNIKSKFKSASSTRIYFESEYMLEVNHEKKFFQWEMTVNTNKSKNDIYLQSERVYVDGVRILDYALKEGGFVKSASEKEEISLFKGMSSTSSVMKMVRTSEGISQELQVLIQFLDNLMSFELLSPNEMRLSSRGAADTIGMSGKNLPSFIKQMNQEQRASFKQKLEFLLSGRISDVDAVSKGKAGWTEINLKEKYEKHLVSVTSKELSDGVLRLLAFIAISEIKAPAGIILLDEVENGINVDYAEGLMKIMQNLYREKQHQLIMTTHSTVFLDYIKAEDIIFLYRDENGHTKAIHLFEKNYFKEKLAYMYPGEVFVNMSQKELLEEVLAIQGV